MTETPQIHNRPPTSQDEWLFVAKVFRDALKVVRPGEYPLCLPGEPQACGGDAAGHVLATAALLGAIGLHHAEYAGPHRVSEFWDCFDGHRITLARHHGGACDCDKATG